MAAFSPHLSKFSSCVMGILLAYLPSCFDLHGRKRRRRYVRPYGQQESSPVLLRESRLRSTDIGDLQWTLPGGDCRVNMQ